MNGYDFTDSLQLRIKEYNAGEFQIEGKSSALSHVDSEILTYEISDFVKIIETKGSGIFNMTLKANGSIEKTGYIYEVNSKIQVGSQEIYEKIETDVKWLLMENYRL